MRGLARQRAPTAAVLPGTFASLPPDFRADGAFCLASLYHVPRKHLPQALARLRAALGVSGVLMTSFPCEYQPFSGWSSDGSWVTLLPIREHKEVVRRAGFEVLGADDQVRIYNARWGVVFARVNRDVFV